ncbi:radical SAM protein [archaeon]|nr:radical SAM protein [archaeon]|tara:strand:+ start:501 stop:1469 length:969 start_codon:yes stop_codon:yes gene_type:complete
MIKIKRGIPLMGCIAFGIIERGTNLLQVRPTSMCNMNCVFCSTDSGPFSQYHKNNFEVELDYLVEEVERIVFEKDCEMEINIDSVGEPLMYKDIVKLVKNCKEMENVVRVSMQTNGVLLTKEKIKDLKKAGLDVVNLSISAMDLELGKKLSGTKSYDITKIKNRAKDLIKADIKVRLCPVWIPGVNDDEIEKIIEFSQEIYAHLGIQKYEVYKYSRKVKKVKPLNWWKFFNQLKKWEKKYETKLILDKKDMGIKKAKRVKEMFKKGDRVQVEVKLPGWFSDQKIGIAKDRCISINNCTKNINDLVNVKILETKNNLYIGEEI